MSRRTRIDREAIKESVRLYIQMQSATTEAEFQELLARHDACTDANHAPRMKLGTLAEFREGPKGGPAVERPVATSAPVA